jgi:hypothetical protein
MFPPITVADIQAEFDRVNAGVPCVADKSDTLSDKVRPGLASGAAARAEKLHNPWLGRIAEIKAARPDAETLQFSEQLNCELRTGDINKQVDQLKAHMAAKLDFSRAGPPASSKQVAADHYKDLPIQPAEYCQRNGLGFCESSVVKYVSRYKSKNGVEDLRKARHFLDLLIEMHEKDAGTTYRIKLSN